MRHFAVVYLFATGDFALGLFVGGFTNSALLELALLVVLRRRRCVSACAEAYERFGELRKG